MNKILSSILFSVFILLGMGMQQIKAQEISWVMNQYPKVTPNTIAVLSDTAEVELYFTTIQSNIPSAKVEIVFPPQFLYLGMENGIGHDSQVTVGTPTVSGTAVTGQKVVVDVATHNGGALHIGDYVHLKFKISANCSANALDSIKVRILSNTSSVLKGSVAKAIGTRIPAIRFTCDNSSLIYATQDEIKTFTMKLDAEGGKVFTLKVFLQTDYGILSDFKLDGLPLTAIKTNVGRDTLYTLTLTSTELNGVLAATPKYLTFSAGSKRCGSRVILTRTQLDADQNCKSYSGAQLTMTFHEEKGTPYMDFSTGDGMFTYVKSDFETILSGHEFCTDGITGNLAKMTYVNKSTVEAHDMVIHMGLYSDIMAFLDTAKMYYQIGNGSRKKVRNQMIISTNQVRDRDFGAYYKPEFRNKPFRANIQIPEVVLPGDSITIWATVIGGDVYDNQNHTVIYDQGYTVTTFGFLGRVDSVNNQCGVKGGGNSQSVNIRYWGKPSIKNVPSDESFRANEVKTQELALAFSASVYSPYNLSAEVFIQTPTWLRIDGNLDDAIQITHPGLSAYQLAAYQLSRVDHGNGKYSVKITSVGIETNFFLTIRYKSGSCPSTTTNYDDVIHYWVDWHFNPGPCRPVMQKVSQVFQPVHFLCKEDGFVLTDFNLKRITRGFKDSNNDGVPDNGTKAPDNEIQHDTYVLKDSGEFKWMGRIAGLPSTTYKYLYVTLYNEDIDTISRILSFNSTAEVKINGFIYPVSYSKIDNRRIYIHLNASAQPLKGGDQIEIIFNFRVQNLNNKIITIKTEAFVSNVTFEDPYLASGSDRHGEDKYACSMITYELDNLFYIGNDAKYYHFPNNNPIFLSNAYTDVFHATFKNPWFKNEVRRHNYPYHEKWVLPEGYILAYNDTMYIKNTQKDAHSNNKDKKIAPVLVNGNIIEYDIYPVYDTLFDGSPQYPTVDPNKWMLPDDSYRLFNRVYIKATRGAKRGKEILNLYLTRKIPGAGFTYQTCYGILEYSGMSIYINSGQDTIPAYGRQQNIAPLTIQNPSIEDLQNLWIYVDGNVKDVALIHPVTKDTLSKGQGYQGRWVKVADEIKSGQSIVDILSYTYTNGNNCNKDSIRIYTISGFDTPWNPSVHANSLGNSPAVNFPIDLKDYDHNGGRCKIIILQSSSSIDGSLIYDKPQLIYDSVYTLRATLDARQGEGSLKEAYMQIQIPAGQEYMPESAWIEYPVGILKKVPVLVENALRSGNTEIGNDRIFTFTLAEVLEDFDFVLPGFLVQGVTDQMRQATLILKFRPKCATNIYGIQYRGKLFAKTLCGANATNNGKTIQGNAMSTNVTSDYLFEVNTAIKSQNRAFNEIRTQDTLEVILKKITGPASNMKLTDSLVIEFPGSVNINGISKVITTLAGVPATLVQGSNSLVSGLHTIRFGLPVAQYDAAPQKGKDIELKYLIPIEYTPDGQTLAATPLQKMNVLVRSSGQFHSSCTPQPLDIGSNGMEIALVTAQENPAAACFETPVALKITSSNFTGAWYREVTALTQITAANPFNYTPAVQEDTVFYVSSVFNGINYGVVPVQVKMNPQVTAAFRANEVCAGNVTFISNLTTVDGITDDSKISKWEWYDENVLFSTDKTPVYLFSAGNHSVKLVVTTTAGCKDSITYVITVKPRASVQFTMTPSPGCTGNKVSLVSTSTIFGGTLTHYQWDFGDGSPYQTGSSITYAYDNAGTYPIKLVVTTDNGCTDSLTQNYTVNTSPVPSLNGPLTVCTRTPVKYITESGMSLYSWNSTNGTIIQGLGTNEVTVVWDTEGHQKISVEYKHTNGCMASTIKQVVVNEKPEFSFESPIYIFPSEKVDLTALTPISGSISGLNMLYFSDAACTTPVSAPTQVGKGVYYLVGHKNSCSDTTEVQIMELSTPQIALLDSCSTQPVLRLNIEYPGATYKWYYSTDNMNWGTPVKTGEDSYFHLSKEGWYKVEMTFIGKTISLPSAHIIIHQRQSIVENIIWYEMHLVN